MDYIIIEVPDMNDSISRIVLNGTVYHIRFTYNDTCDYWTFGLYDALNAPIALSLKIVPRYPLNIHLGTSRFPNGFFAAKTKLDRIGRNDFKLGNAQFIFCPVTVPE